MGLPLAGLIGSITLFRKCIKVVQIKLSNMFSCETVKRQNHRFSTYLTYRVYSKLKRWNRSKKITRLS
jgi:hypothetical protein